MTTTAPIPPHSPAQPATSRPADPLPPLLCAVTLDSRGEACLRYAYQRAANTGQPLSVVHILHQTMRTAGFHQRNTRRPRLLLPLLDIAHDLLDEFLDDFPRASASADANLASVTIERIIEPGVPGTRVPELAERIGATSLIIGGTRRAPWRRLLRGSIAADILRRSPIPVTVVDSVGQPIDPKDILSDLAGSRDFRSWLAHLLEGRRRATL